MANREGRTLRLGNRFGYILAAPANPAVQAHLQAVVLDIVDRFPVDGVHFDYIRLPDHDYSYDAVSRRRFLRESEDTDTYLGWQAREITGMLQRISDSVRPRRPGLIMSAAIVNHYHRAVGIFAQDPLSWLECGALDYVIPMMYTPSLSEYLDMITGYLEVLPPERIVAGLNLGEMPDDPATVAAQVYHSVVIGVRGHAFFSLADVDALVGKAPIGPENLYSYLETLQGATFEQARPAEPAPAAGADRSGEPETGLSRAAVGRLVALLTRVSKLIVRVIR